MATVIRSENLASENVPGFHVVRDEILTFPEDKLMPMITAEDFDVARSAGMCFIGDFQLSRLVDLGNETIITGFRLTQIKGKKVPICICDAEGNRISPDRGRQDILISSKAATRVPMRIENLEEGA